MKITHFASTADRYGDMCIVDLDKLKIMIDGGATKTDALLLYNNMIGDYKKLFVLSHWHSDHSAYLSYQNHNIKTILGRGCNGLVYPDDNDITIETGNDYVLWDFIKIYSSRLLDIDENSNSMVTVILYDNINYFSFGDATPDAVNSYNEEIFYLINNSPNPIIKLPHHGSLGNCSALLEKINNNGIRYIISGLGGDYVYNTVNAVLSIDSNYLYWVAKQDSNYYGTESFRQAQYRYRNRFVYANRVIVNPDGSIRYIE